jgi:DNA-binding response OmpR family regulator
MFLLLFGEVFVMMDVNQHLMPKVMIVEDDEDILFVVTFILKQNGLSVIPLSDGEKAIEEALQSKPDLILFDINLGRYDGRQLCLELKTVHHVQIPILLFSANVTLASTIQSYKADGFIAKPFDMDLLVNTVRKELNAA